MGVRGISLLLSAPARTFAFRYLLVGTAANFLWESAQLPLYTMWATASQRGLAYALIHCTVGDAVILSVTLVFAFLIVPSSDWPRRNYTGIALAATGLGIAYTILSEWLNVNVLQSWAYAPAMPVVPPFRTGLSPLAQWIIIPSAIFTLLRPPRRGTYKN